MEIAYFTKTLQGLALERAAEITADIGFECVDLLIRDEHAVTPDAPEAIAGSVKTYAEHGLRTIMATIELDAPGCSDRAAPRQLRRCRDRAGSPRLLALRHGLRLAGVGR